MHRLRIVHCNKIKKQRIFVASSTMGKALNPLFFVFHFHIFPCIQSHFNKTKTKEKSSLLTNIKLLHIIKPQKHWRTVGRGCARVNVNPSLHFEHFSAVFTAIKARRRMSKHR